jgi:hypothetical protein
MKQEVEVLVKLILTPIGAAPPMNHMLYEMIEDEIIEQYPPIFTVSEGTENEITFLVEVESARVREDHLP